MKHQLLLTETEAAELLRVCARTLRKARAAGLLRYVLIGRAVRYTVADLESYIDALRQKAAPCPSPAKPTRSTGKLKTGQIIPFTARTAAR